MPKDRKMKKRKRKVGILPKLILVVFVVYASATLISNKVEANERRAEANKKDEIISNEQLRKMQLEELLSQEENDEYMRRLAEEQGYVDPNAIIFEDISGN